MSKQFMRVVDTTLRDGAHNVRHQFTPAQMAEIATALDDAGIDTIEIGHGDGLAGHSINYGFAAATDEAVVRVLETPADRVRVLLFEVPKSNWGITGVPVSRIAGRT